MNGKKYLKLDAIEMGVVGAASRIFAAYVTAGQVNDENAEQFIQKAAAAAIQLSAQVDDMVKTDGEMS